MADQILTESEGSRVSWAAEMLGVTADGLLRTTCQVKSFLSSRPALMTSIQAQLASGFDPDGKAARALTLMISAGTAAAALNFSSNLGSALALALEAFGIAVTATTLGYVVALVAIVVLLVSLAELPGALRSLSRTDFTMS